MTVSIQTIGIDDNLADLTATEYLRLLKAGKITAGAYARACAGRIAELEPEINAWEIYDHANFVAKADSIDAALAAGEPLRAMTGVPVGVKDIFNTYDFPTSMGSEILKGYTPGNDARVVSNIRNEGGIIPGKTVTAEFAVHYPGPTVNPRDHTRTPGTSSSGSAAAVAAAMIPVALATQTAGSIIRPSSYCGIMGFKPSFGLLPRTAMLKTTDTLDTIGFMARSVDDLHLMFEVTRVRGHNYPISEKALADSDRQTVSGRKVRVGLVEGPKTSFEAKAARRSLEELAGRFAALDMEVVPFILPEAFNEAHDIHEHIYCRALAYYFKHEWSQARNKFSDIMQQMIERGLTVTPEEYQSSLDRQVELSALLDETLAEQGIDIAIGLSTADEAPVGLFSTDLPDHCLIWTMCGVPAISLPMLSGSSGLPVGLQVISRRFQDYLLLDQCRRIWSLGSGEGQ